MSTAVFWNDKDFHLTAWSPWNISGTGCSIIKKWNYGCYRGIWWGLIIYWFMERMQSCLIYAGSRLWFFKAYAYEANQPYRVPSSLIDFIHAFWVFEVFECTDLLLVNAVNVGSVLSLGVQCYQRRNALLSFFFEQYNSPFVRCRA